MKLKSVFKAPEGSIMVGLGLAAATYAIYGAAVPSATDIRSADAHNADVEAGRKAAAWKSAALIGLVFLITQDQNAALIGGAALGGIDLMVKHANGINPTTGKLAGRDPGAPADNDVAFPLPDYSDPDQSDDQDPGY